MQDDTIPPLQEVLCPDCILIHPESEDRDDVWQALLKQLVTAGKLKQSQLASARRGLNEREQIGSTALGDGIALPHARVRFTDELILGYALLKNGTGFNALDGAPVQHVFMLFSPKENDALHIAFLKSLMGFAHQHIHLKALQGSTTPAEVLSVLQDYS